MAATPSELANAARCIECAIPPGMQGAVLIYLFQQIAGNTQTPAELAESAKCIECVIPPGEQAAVMVYLLQQIAGT